MALLGLSKKTKLTTHLLLLDKRSRMSSAPPSATKLTLQLKLSIYTRQIE